MTNAGEIMPPDSCPKVVKMKEKGIYQERMVKVCLLDGEYHYWTDNVNFRCFYMCAVVNGCTITTQNIITNEQLKNIKIVSEP